jgi:ABC-type multidrug transport system ATPase subunit
LSQILNIIFLGSGVPGKRVGYMPQEIALYGEFSIRETMMYFGWIFGMETMEIHDRLKFLLSFLDLPSENRLVKNLRFVWKKYCCMITLTKSC